MAIAISNVPTVIRNLIIFTIILCVLNSIMNFTKINSELDETMDSSSFINYIYENEELSQYQEEIEKTIDETKGYSPIVGFCWGFFFFIIGLLVVLFERNKTDQMTADKGRLSTRQ